MRFAVFLSLMILVNCASALNPECQAGTYACSNVYPNGVSVSCANFSDKTLCKKCQAECEVDAVLDSVKQVLIGVGAGLAVLFLTIQGFRLLTAGPKERTEAKRGIIYIVIGIAIMLGAYALIRYFS